MPLAKENREGRMERGSWQLLGVPVQREEFLGGWLPIFGSGEVEATPTADVFPHNIVPHS